MNGYLTSFFDTMTPALEATPVTKMASYDMDSWWVVNLKMMEI
jgi:hypothetical protein